MFFGLLELILLLLSGSTFVFAVCLMTWIIFKTNFIQSIWREKRGEYQLEKKPDSRASSDSPKSSSCLTSPVGSGVSDGTRQHILTSHPHFWEHLEKQNYSTYGSFGKECSQSGLQSNYTVYEGNQHFSYGTLQFQLLELKSPKTEETLYQLLSIQALQVNFCLKDIYVELKCHVSSQISLDLADAFELFSTKGNGRSFIIPKFMSNRQEKPKRQTGEYRFNIPLSKMVEKTKPGKIIIFTANSKLAETRGFGLGVKMESLIYMKRGHGRVYIGEGILSDFGNPIHMSEHLHPEIDKEEHQSEDAVKVVDVCMDYIHKPQLTVGKVNISITYLPTAEKLSVCIKEFTVDKELSQNMSDLYWKIKLIKINKDVMKHKIPVTEDPTELDKQNAGMHWSCGKVVTFDRTKINSILDATVVCRLMAKLKGNTGKSTMYSCDGMLTDRVHYSNGKAATTQFDMEKGNIKSGISRNISTRKGNLCVDNKTRLLPSNKEVAYQGIYAGIETEDRGYNSPIDRSRRTGSLSDIVLGELYLGTGVPDTECRELWVQVLMNSRCAVQKWLSII